jgi:hypothetical protein
MKPLVREIGAATLYGAVGWTISAAALSIASWTASVTSAALAAHAVAVPLAFGLISVVYFRRAAPLRPVFAGLLFASLVVVLDAAARPLLHYAFDVLLGTWLPAYSALLVTWLAGLVATEARTRTA